ncbi:hypothetical protein N7495_007231 [Penicillium taxi]|uniref:uncharacterized protein n=1 Tax=Penicillium taxi TaxID=168475 RepID=UPI002544EF61|nr:uncharacterized protein N7495_007231 [Penicillium taxi]KAJ5895540.1 hypothetical protein N7495_007231 [Penicillium taxi]
MAMPDQPNDSQFLYHLSLLKLDTKDDQNDMSLTPIFNGPALTHTPRLRSSQYGLLGGAKYVNVPHTSITEDNQLKDDRRVFFNVSSPSSTFICGSQGSGKSHTLSCMLEGCLLRSEAGRLENPLTAVVFHYDTFISDEGGSPCEAAFLASNPNIKVRVLCAPTNIRTIQATYERLNIEVEPLQIDQANLNTKRMMDLMSVGQDGGLMPLYMRTVQRVLREMRLVQQENGTIFDYSAFKNRVLSADLMPSQLEPLKQRLDTLESFMPSHQTTLQSQRSKKTSVNHQSGGSSWKPIPSQLTIVDLSCPCISADTACSLFNVCFGIFMDQNTKVGRIVALDEAHKYMSNSIEAENFTNTLLSTVRLQRHLGVRIMISTQEPTISSALLSLCSVTIVHRFSSPAWSRALQCHIAGAAFDKKIHRNATRGEEDEESIRKPSEMAIFDQIVSLQVGEALLFSPSAIIGTSAKDPGAFTFSRLGSGYVVLKVRDRLTEDGGKSIVSL